MTLSVLEPSISFSMSHDCMTVTCVNVTHDIMLHFYLSPKIKKSKIKPSLLFTILIGAY